MNDQMYLSDIVAYMKAHLEWSLKTFGTGHRTEGLLRHIEKEIAEVRSDPLNVFEWVDIVILSLDGALRAGASPEMIRDALWAKQRVNMNRVYPKVAQDEPSEHVRS